MLTDKLNRNEAVVCVVGLGYVGLPLAIEFSKSLRVIGYEIDEDKIKRLNNSESNRENENPFITNDPAKIRDADFVIISVPTPVTRSQEPDLGYVESAAETVSENLKQDSVVILESTVYPGVTEEIIKPILERSGLRCGVDFKVAYSPERLNPNFLRKNLVKPSDIPLRSSQIIVSGMDEETTDIVSKLYARITTVYAAKDIRTGEAGAVVVSHEVNKGKGRAVKTSLGYAAEHGFDALVLLDGDGQHDPGEIPGLLEPISNDTADLVIGFRSFGQMPFYRRFGRAVLDHVTGAGGTVTDSQSRFRALNRKATLSLAGVFL